MNIPHPPMPRESFWPDSVADADTGRITKKVAKKGITAMANAQHVGEGVGAFAMSAGAAAASATGIGLLAGAGIYTIASSVLAFKSARSTKSHINALESIYQRRHALSCNCIDPKQTRSYRQHEVVADIVIPYILSKKGSKFHRKVASVVPGVGGLETGRGIAKNLYKRLRGTLGVNRNNAAKWLAVHAVTHNCAMTQMVIADLWGYNNLPGLLKLHSDKLAENMAEKMKST